MILVTGAAGFIGYHTATKLLASGRQVIGLDNLNPYYDVALKQARIKRLEANPSFTFIKADIADRTAIQKIFAEHQFKEVVHLAAQAGVRHSLTHPHDYIDTNVMGFLNILEGCRHTKGFRHLVFASSSSVYGLNTAFPWSEHHGVDHPMSLYAATKKSNELMAHSYSHLYNLPATGLRFFTAYGPWGRPDMALFMFTRAILQGEPIDVYNHGNMERDFTYIDDVVEGIAKVIEQPAKPKPAWSSLKPDIATSNAPYRLFNIGNNRPERLLSLIEHIENITGLKAEKRMMPLQPGDISRSCADISDLQKEMGFAPKTPLKLGVERFVEWYCEYYGIDLAAVRKRA